MRVTPEMRGMLDTVVHTSQMMIVMMLEEDDEETLVHGEEEAVHV